MAHFKDPQSGISLIEIMMASLIIMVCSLGVLGLVVSTITTNYKNKVGSTQTMLAESVIEQVHSTLIGVGTSSLTDCAGTPWTIETAPGGANLNSTGIDFSQTSIPANYSMTYVVQSPCSGAGSQPAVYDVRWHVDIVGAPTVPTNTYLITVAARLQGGGPGSASSSPATMRVLAGN
jgi:hypothetical protein